MRANRLLGIVIATTLTATVAFGSVAGAANLGPQAPQTLGAWIIPGGTGAPNVITWANFTGPNNTNLAATALNGGGTWIAQFGTWKLSSKNTANSSNTTLSNLTTAVGTVSAAVESTTLDFGGNPRAGLIGLSNGTSFVYAIYTKTAGGTVQLYKYVSGVSTLLASTTGVGLPIVAPMRLDAMTNTIRVWWDGTARLSYTLTASEVTLLKSAGHDRFGIIADGDASTTFDDFHVDH